METYSARAKCTNCKVQREIEIPMGKPMIAHEEEISCNICGCKCIIVPLREW